MTELLSLIQEQAREAVRTLNAETELPPMAFFAGEGEHQAGMLPLTSEALEDAETRNAIAKDVLPYAIETGHFNEAVVVTESEVLEIPGEDLKAWIASGHKPEDAPKTTRVCLAHITADCIELYMADVGELDGKRLLSDWTNETKRGVVSVEPFFAPTLEAIRKVAFEDLD